MDNTNLINDLELGQRAKELFNQKKYLEIIYLLQKHVSKGGLDPWAYALFGYALFIVTKKEHPKVVLDSLELAIKIKPDQAEFYYFLAVVAQNFINPSSSIEIYKKAIRFNSKIDMFYLELAFVYSFLGQTEDMLATLKEGINATNSDKLFGIFLQFSNYDINLNMQDQQIYTKQFYQNYKQKYLPKTYQYDPQRYDKNKSHLKIGFFSSQGLTDWAGVRSICKFLNKDKFSIYAYASVPSETALPEYCKNIKASYVEEIIDNCARWENFAGLSLEAIAENIHNDDIDILIDLAGTAGYNYGQEPFIGLTVRKPAPVVATWLSASGSTGVDEMDYFITSRHQILEGDDKFFTETLCGLDSGLFQVQLNEVMELPDIQEPPCLSNSYITFGSFHFYVKFTNNVYKTWAAILKRVPNSKLMLKYAKIDDPIVSDNVKKRFEKLGVSRDRIVIEGADSKFNFQNAYNKIDIALDPFPYSGGTTTTDSLYMGVPVITNMADRTSSRVCAGILIANGYDELVANSEQEYIEKAVELANDRDRIINYKATLRDKVINGKMRADNFANDFANALTWMWQRTCDLRS